VAKRSPMSATAEHLLIMHK